LDSRYANGFLVHMPSRNQLALDGSPVLRVTQGVHNAVGQPTLTTYRPKRQEMNSATTEHVRYR